MLIGEKRIGIMFYLPMSAIFSLLYSAHWTKWESVGNATRGLGGILGGKKAPLVVWERKDWGNTSASYVEHVLKSAILPFPDAESRTRGYRVLPMEDGGFSIYSQQYTRMATVLHHPEHELASIVSRPQPH